MDWLFDERTNCWSVQTSIQIKDYIDMVDTAHQTRGAIAGQRDVLTTTTAKRIRARMIADLKMGAVLPPVVIGAVIDQARFDRLPLDDAKSIRDVLSATDLESLAIIDGMQRTAAIVEAANDGADIGERKLRVEFWVATSVRAMIYRMLVLNTGQVPWTISRQLSVVFDPLLTEIHANVPDLDKMSSPDKPGRRRATSTAFQRRGSRVVYCVSLRKTAVDTKEVVSDEFSRLDFVDNVADSEFPDPILRRANRARPSSIKRSRDTTTVRGSRFQRGATSSIVSRRVSASSSPLAHSCSAVPAPIEHLRNELTGSPN